MRTLTEREKQTLRLLLVGHDAKSIARHLGLSVHTINERLRDARRKLSVSSSREAARLLFEHEGGDPEKLGDRSFGDADAASGGHQAMSPDDTPRPFGRVKWALGGCAMTALLAAVLALSSFVDAPQSGDTPARVAPAESTVVRTARNWLLLVDDQRWDASWAATGQSFRSANTVQMWRSASETARVPLGRVLSRTLLDEQDTPSPPNGFRVVRFRTDFSNKHSATEILSLDREGEDWKVVGVYIE